MYTHINKTPTLIGGGLLYIFELKMSRMYTKWVVLYTLHTQSVTKYTYSDMVKVFTT